MSAISQASSTVAHCAVDPASVAGELKIRVFEDHFVRFSGTSAQLIAEDLIPPDFTWPEGRRDAHWSRGNYDFSLCRSRPDDHKGPMSLWRNGDHWSVCVSLHGNDWQRMAQKRLERKAQALREEARALTSSGMREYWAARDRFSTAVGDQAFQEFKARVPGLVPPKRGRPAKGGAA